MKKYYIFLFVIIILLSACSTGKKALQKGNYFSAVSKSVQRLKSDPNNKNALTVLKDGYPLAINWSQEEMDQILSINQSFKWGRAVRLMEQVNKLSEEIRQSPAALNIIEEPKTYISELNMAREKAAEERYSAGIELLEMGTRESAREAFEHFYKTNNFIHGYRNVLEKINEAKALATVTVILEAMPVHTQKYKLTSEFFYDQVFEYLNNKFPNESFVNFYSPEQAEHAGLEYPDMIVKLEFYDFVVGQISHSEKEEEVKKRVKIETRDTTRVQYNNYVAKLKTYTDKVYSSGRLDVKIIEFDGSKIRLNDRVHGSFTWINDYAIFAGDKEALNKEQLELTKRKVAPMPPGQDLFIEFTKPIYDQLTGKLNRFFKKYN